MPLTPTILRVAILPLIVCAVCFSLAPSVMSEEAPLSAFDKLLARAQNLDPELDFDALRYSYTETPSYSPYDPDALPTIRAAIAAYRAGDYQRSRELLENVLSKDPVNLSDHIWAALACEKLARDDRTRYHQYVADGIVRSIRESGDGTIDRPFRVISDIEQYVTLDQLGVDSVRKIELRHATSYLNHYDVRSRKDKSEFFIIFNIDLQYPHKPKSDD